MIIRVWRGDDVKRIEACCVRGGVAYNNLVAYRQWAFMALLDYVVGYIEAVAFAIRFEPYVECGRGLVAAYAVVHFHTVGGRGWQRQRDGRAVARRGAGGQQAATLGPLPSDTFVGEGVDGQGDREQVFAPLVASRQQGFEVGLCGNLPGAALGAAADGGVEIVGCGLSRGVVVCRGAGVAVAPVDGARIAGGQEFHWGVANA